MLHHVFLADISVAPAQRGTHQPPSEASKAAHSDSIAATTFCETHASGVMEIQVTGPSASTQAICANGEPVQYLHARRVRKSVTPWIPESRNCCIRSRHRLGIRPQRKPNEVEIEP